MKIIRLQVPAPIKYIPLSTWLLGVKAMIFLLGAFHYLKKLKILSRPKKMKAAEPKVNPNLIHRHWSRKVNRETRESCRIFGRYLHRIIPPASRVQGLHQRRSLVSLSKWKRHGHMNSFASDLQQLPVCLHVQKNSVAKCWSWPPESGFSLQSIFHWRQN